MKMRKPRGNETERSIFHPPKKRTMPASNTSKEKRLVNTSAPSDPPRSRTTPPTITKKPKLLGLTSLWTQRAR